jgi:hypothetical protein
MEEMIPKKDPRDYAKSVLDDAVSVITRPDDFYRRMPRAGGFTDPLIFLAVVSFAAGVVQAVLSLFGFGMSGAYGLASIIITPILAAIFGFVGAAIMFGIWKLMGSEQDYEVAYRCTAYAGAIGPITTLVHPIPYIGALVGIAWGIYLMMIASTEVHGIDKKKAQTVLGAIAVVLALISLSAEHSARKFTSKMADMSSKIEQMTPEEAGKKVGEFLKGMEKGAKDQ